MGGEDIKDEEGDLFEVVTQPEDLKESKRRSTEKIALASAQITMVPKNTVTVDESM